MKITTGEAQRQRLIARYTTILQVAMTSLYTEGEILSTTVTASDWNRINRRIKEMIKDAREHNGESVMKASVNVKNARKIWKM